jgi:uncharacterized RDD family membrane protein YckC
LDTNTVVTEALRARCAECKGQFSVDEMIRHGDAYVCAKCKPVFMQKLAEGAAVPTARFRYAGFWLRFGAVFLDGIALFIVMTGAQLALFGATFGQVLNLEPRSPLVVMVSQVLSLSLGVAYETFMIGKYGATLGKMACKIHVITADGGRVGYLRAFGRYFGKLLSTFTLMIGYLMAAFDSEGRSLHDRICNTRVVME